MAEKPNPNEGLEPEEARPVALGILKRSLLLSNNELLPLLYFDSSGEPVDTMEEASRFAVHYNDLCYSFPADEMDRFTVH